MRSASETPVITAPRQIVALVDQTITLPLTVRDADQDALSYSAQGLPAGATFTAQPQYGHAVLIWTPTSADLGTHDISLEVTDSGLGPQDIGTPVDPSATPVPNSAAHTLRVIVRDSNAAPELLGVQVNDTAATLGALASAIPVTAAEGVPLTLELIARDTDLDPLTWTTTGLPPGMTVEAQPGSSGSARLILRWTPDYFSAQSHTPGEPLGHYRVSVQASDGVAALTQTFDLSVTNTNLAPQVLPLPLQLIREGDTLSTTLRAADPDGDALQLALIHDATTPAGVFFDPQTGVFEWTPDYNTVNNAIANDVPYTFTFSANDGTVTTATHVQVRVLDLNRAPELTVSNHALVVGQSFNLPVILGRSPGSLGLTAQDPDGDAQTAALAIRFTGLPEGAAFDATTQRLTWTPGPGQLGDTLITARADDGRAITSHTFTLRVVADASANAPNILISTTPSTPTNPGQSVLITVRASGYSPIHSLAVQVRGMALDLGDADTWHTVALDNLGRLRLTPQAPGLIDIQVTAIDQDGFRATQTHSVRVKDPADTQAPALAWSGDLKNATLLTAPVTFTALTAVQATLQDRQLMGYSLAIAPVTDRESRVTGADHGQTLASQTTPASDFNTTLNLATLDPATLANGVYTLRLSAWDLAGRTSEIEARVIIDSAEKTLATHTATDQIYTLGGHDLALTRVLDGGITRDSLSVIGPVANDLGNWRFPLLDTRLSHDQPALTAPGTTAPWQEGARVWLQLPASPALANAALQLKLHPEHDTRSPGHHRPCPRRLPPRV